ncbi:MAG: hypothetical protein ACC656_12295 [Candidatus Heimdallarchaeota archaeon]
MKQSFIFDNLPEDKWSIKTVNHLRNSISFGKIGSINVSYKELVVKLGTPLHFDDHVTQVEWFIEFFDSKCCRIYDYQSDLQYKKIQSWSIDGNLDFEQTFEFEEIVEYIRKNFPNNKIFTAWDI